MGAMSVSRGRVVVLGLLVCAVACVVVLGVRSPAVRAQEPAATSSPVAVTDFANSSGYGGDAVGRSAVDALVLALDESKQFEPLKRAEVEQAMARLGFTVPLSPTAQGKLGQELEVGLVASGSVNGVHFEQTNEGRIAVVDITVMLLNVDSGEFSNGARVVRSSTPKPAYTGDDTALVDEALTLATYDAVRTMISYKMPRATILSATPTDVYLNAGSRSGLKQGMELVVLRFGEKVGRLRITEVEPTYATAGIVANYRGITPGDSVFPVFEPPTAGRAAVVQRARARTTLTSTALSLAAAAGIFFTLSKHSPAEVAVPGVAASAFSDPAGSRKGILLTWSPAGHEAQNVRAYEIFRNDAVIWVKPAAGADPTGSGTYFIDEEMDSFDGISKQLAMAIDGKSGALTAFNLTTNANQPPGSGGADGIVFARWFIHTPPEAGQQYIYRVVAVVAHVVFIAGGTAAPARAFQLKESAYGGSSIATFVEPPPLVAPAPGAEVTDLTAVDFSWNAVAGADEYVLQISRDAFFLPVSTRTFTLQRDLPAGAAMTQTVNVAQIFPPPAGEVMTVHWRVGARAIRDPIAPRLDPAWSQVYPQDQGYVWSTPGNSTFFFTAAPAGAATAQPGRAPRRIRWWGPLPH